MTRERLEAHVSNLCLAGLQVCRHPRKVQARALLRQQIEAAMADLKADAAVASQQAAMPDPPTDDPRFAPELSEAEQPDAVPDADAGPQPQWWQRD